MPSPGALGLHVQRREASSGGTGVGVGTVSREKSWAVGSRGSECKFPRIRATSHGCSEIHLRGCHTQKFLALSPKQGNVCDSLGVTPTPGWHRSYPSSMWPSSGQLSLIVTLQVPNIKVSIEAPPPRGQGARTPTCRVLVCPET